MRAGPAGLRDSTGPSVSMSVCRCVSTGERMGEKWEDTCEVSGEQRLQGLPPNLSHSIVLSAQQLSNPTFFFLRFN